MYSHFMIKKKKSSFTLESLNSCAFFLVKVVIHTPLPFSIIVVVIYRGVLPFIWRTSLTCMQTISVQCFSICGVHGSWSKYSVGVHI